MADLEAFTTAWYWTPTGELRECFVIEVTVLGVVTRAVLDAATLEPVDVAPEDIIVQPD